MFGLLNIDKPGGMTSRDVVNRVQRLVRPVKVGHAGTLDPLATGVLVVCLGQATRLIEYVQRMPKRYRGTFLLGRESDTEDIEGIVVELANVPRPTREEIEAALPRFVGAIEQRPPAYSALKVEGQRAYKLARRGEPVELAPRRIEIYGLRIVQFAYPELVLDIECGSGTYVRSLGRDVARSLGTGAVMSALVRTAIGEFRLEEACRLEALSAASIVTHLLPASRAVAMLPSVRVTKEEAKRLANGQMIENRSGEGDGEIAIENESGQLIAIAEPRNGSLAPTKYFPS